jgi:hypothetical protein
MLNNKSKALTVVFLTMAAALPELSMPAAAYLPGQIGAVGSSGPNLDDSNLLTEVRQNYHGNTFFYPRRGYNYGGNGYNNYHGGNHYSGHGHGHNNNDNGLYYGLQGLGLGYGLWYGAEGGYYDDGGYYEDGYNGGGDHVQWCLNRYRSFSPRTDTFVGYDGYRHCCHSPY